MVFTIHQHESSAGIHVSPCPEPPSNLSTHPVPVDIPEHQLWVPWYTCQLALAIVHLDRRHGNLIMM